MQFFMSALAEPFGVRVILFAHDARRDHARFDRHRLVDHAFLVGVVTHLDVARQRELLADRLFLEVLYLELLRHLACTLSVICPLDFKVLYVGMMQLSTFLYMIKINMLH